MKNMKNNFIYYVFLPLKFRLPIAEEVCYQVLGTVMVQTEEIMVKMETTQGLVL